MLFHVVSFYFMFVSPRRLGGLGLVQGRGEVVQARQVRIQPTLYQLGTSFWQRLKGPSSAVSKPILAMAFFFPREFLDLLNARHTYYLVVIKNQHVRQIRQELVYECRRFAANLYELGVRRNEGAGPALIPLRAE